MGHEIIYGRQFVKTSAGIVPLILGGSSNCTMFRGGKEIPEREWFPVTADKLRVMYSAAELMAYAEKIAANDSDNEIFEKGGKWTYGKDMPKFFQAGIKAAMTIERIRQFRPEQSLRCCVVEYGANTFGSVSRSITSEQYVRTTADLERWVMLAEQEVAAIKAIDPKADVMLSMKFMGYEPLNIERMAAFGEGIPVIAMYKRGFYVSRIDGPAAFTSERGTEKALVFEDADEAMAKLPRNYTFQLVRADAKKREEQSKAKPKFALMVTAGTRTGWYVYKLSRTKLYWIAHAASAKMFATEKAALKWANEHGLTNGRFGDVVTELEAVEIGKGD